MKLQDACSVEEKLDRDITLPAKVCIVKAMVFPVVMYRCETWTIKQAKHWRIDAFELWCWRRLLRVPWAARSNQSSLKEINPELKGLILKLKLQYFGHLMQRANSLEKNPYSRINWRQEEKGTTEDEVVGWHHQLNGYEFEQTPGDSDGPWSLVCCSPWGHKDSDTTEQLNSNIWFSPGRYWCMTQIMDCESGVNRVFNFSKEVMSRFIYFLGYFFFLLLI